MGKNAKKWLAGTMLALALMGALFASSLRRSESAIEASLLQMAPLGSTIDQVERAIRERKLGRPSVMDTGVYKQKNPAHPEVVGVKKIQLHLGDYFMPPLFQTSVDAFWAFDGQGRLIDVWVWKTTDGP